MEDGAKTDDGLPWARLAGLIVLALVLTALIAFRSIETSIQHGRLSVPPIYDDVSYFLDAVRWLNAFDGRSWADNLFGLLRQHAPFSTLVALLGFRLFPGSYVGPYVVNATFVLAFLLGIIWLTWKRPVLDVATCLIASSCVPTVWHTVIEGRPDLPWGLSLGIAAGAIVRCGVLQRSRSSLVLLGAGCGLAVSIKPTAFPASLAYLGTVFVLRLLVDCIQAGGLRSSFRKAGAALLAFGVGLLVIAAVLLGPMMADTISYIITVFVTQRDIWTSGASFWSGLRYFLDGAGGNAGLHFWLWAGLSLMAVRLLLSAMQGRAALQDATVVLAAVLIAYVIPSVAEIKSYFFGAIFYGIFVVAMVLNYCASQAAIASYVAASPLAASRLSTGFRALPLAAAILLFVKLVLVGPMSLSLWLNDQQQTSIRKGTERVWTLVREAKSGSSGRLRVGFSSAYPVTPGTIEFYAAQAQLAFEIKQELFHRTLDETEKALLKADIIVVTSSVAHTLTGPRMGDALIERFDANKGVCLLDSLVFPDVTLRVYRRGC